MTHIRVMAGALLALAALPATAQTLPYAVVDTGQTACYDSMGGTIACPAPGQPYSGQDGNFAAHPARYRDNGDGTISDLVTGLMWEKAFRKLPWSDAPAVAAGTRTGGYGDWRVPTIKELYSLMRFSGATGSARPETTGAPADARPYLDTSVFTFEYPSQGRFIDAQYVTSTVYNGLTMGRDRAFFGVNFADGRIKAYPQNGGPGGRQWYARFVRGNPAYGRNDFADNGDGTVTDRATGLTWTRTDSGDAAFRPLVGRTVKGDGRLDWREALAFCGGLNVAGHADWRLPDAKELHSIVDYGRAPGEPAIDPLFRTTPIQEADGSRNWPYFWTSTTHLDGRRPGDFAVYIAFGKAMGNMRLGGGPGGMGGPAGGMGMGGPPPGMGMGGPPMGGGGMGGDRWGGPPPGMGGGMGPPGMGPGGPDMGGGQQGQTQLLDVHGAGAQRSSPKSGDESRLPVGAGPQGDVLRIYNFARCVRG